MLYAQRNAEGAIVAISTTPLTAEEPEVGTAELLEFLRQAEGSQPFVQIFAHLDNEMVRVLEDLIDVLVSKNVIVLTDLPADARRKLFDRKAVRRQMQVESILTDDII